MVKSKMTNKVLAVLVSVAILVGLFPVNWISASGDNDLGTLSLLDANGVAVGESVYGEEAEVEFTGVLDWVAADSSIGRPQDGWWVGVRVTAPEGTDPAVANYQKVKDGIPVGDSVVMSTVMDPENVVDYWCLINEEKLTNAFLSGDTYILYSWQYDWDGDGDYEQLFTLKVKVEDVILNKAGEKVYPLLGSAVKLNSDGEAVGEAITDIGSTVLFENVTFEWVDADADIGRNQDGWWAGIRVTAPEGTDLDKVAYQRKIGEDWADRSWEEGAEGDHIDLWCLINEQKLKDDAATYTWHFDWDGNGNYDQEITLYVDPNSVVLVKNNEKIYPVIGSAVKLSADGKADGEAVTGKEIILSFENVTFEWVDADADIGRNQDGWWAGIRVTAPEGTDLDKVSYQRKIGEDWADRSWTEGAEGDHIDLWCLINEQKLKDDAATYTWHFDWDGNGKYEQEITLSVNPNNVILMQGDVQMYPAVGSAVKLSADGKADGEAVTGKEIILSFENVTFEWVAADADIGRNQDGWWAGIRVTAPEGTDLDKVAYQRKIGEDWADRSWEEGAEGDHIDLWCLINEQKLKDDAATYTWHFDWDGNGEYEQEITLSVNPNNVILMQGDVQMYPAVGSAVKLSADGKADGEAVTGKEIILSFENVTFEWVDADADIGRNQDGWWAGIRVTAPEGTDLDKVAYQRKIGEDWADRSWEEGAEGDHIDLWCLINEQKLKDDAATYTWQFDWDGNGNYEQEITLSVNSANVSLTRASKLVYPMGSVSAITEAVVENIGYVVKESDEESGWYTTADVKNVEFEWDEKDETIGRNERGWWAGIRVTAPEGTDLDKVKYQRKIGEDWAVRSWAEGAEGDHIDFWCLINEQKLKDNAAIYTWRFDWDGNDVYDQYVTFSIDPDTCKLLKKECDDFAFADSIPTKVWIGADKKYVISAESEKSTGTVTYTVKNEDELEKSGLKVAIDENGEVAFNVVDTEEEWKVAEVIIQATIDADDYYYGAEAEFTFTAYKESFVGFGKNEDEITYGKNNNLYVNELVLNDALSEDEKAVTFSIDGDEDIVQFTDNNNKPGELKILKAGTVKIIASFDESYHIPAAEYTLTINKGEQGDFGFENDDNELYHSAESYAIAMKGVLGTGKNTYEVIRIDDNDVAKIVDGEVQTLKEGKFTLKVTNAGDDCYKATSVEKVFEVKYLDAPEDPYTIITSEVIDKNGKVWYNKANAESREISIKPTDNNFLISFNGEYDADDFASVISTPAFTEDGEYTTTVYLKDKNGYITGAITVADLNIDTTAPTQPTITYVGIADSDWQDGYCYKKDSVTVRFAAEDVLSGIDYFLYSLNGGQSYESRKLYANEAGFYEIVIESQYKGSISAKAVDKAGNEGDPTNDTRILVVDADAPVVEVVFNKDNLESKVEKDGKVITRQDHEIVNDNTRFIYSDEITVTLTITEENFFAEDVKVYVKKGSGDYEEKTIADDQWSEKGNHQYETSIRLTENGRYIVKIVYEDRSNNDMECKDESKSSEKQTQIGTYYSNIHTVDKTDPKVAVTYNDQAKNTIGDRKYYDAARTATIKIVDSNFRPNEVDFVVKAVDVTGKEVAFTVPDLKDWSSWEQVKSGVWTAQVPFDVDANYTVTLDYTDLAAHKASSYKEQFTVDTKSPTGLKITYTDSVVEQILEKITFGFYKSRVKVTIEAADATAGIYRLEYQYKKDSSSVNALDKNTLSKIVDINNEKVFGKSGVNLKNGKTSFYLTAGEAEQFRGNISFIAYDRSENSAKLGDDKVVVVDNISPSISVSYEAKSDKTKVNYVNNGKDVESFDKATQAYYNGNAQATITINEANFFEGQSIEDEDGNTIGVVHNVGILLTKVDNEGNKTLIEYLPQGATGKNADETVTFNWKSKGDIHTFTINYNEDADYTLKITYADHSENSADITGNDGRTKSKTYVSKTVTVDKTAPVVNVEYNDLDPVKTKDGREYYNATRVATITITEHNFRAEDVKWAIEALDVTGADVTGTTYSIGNWSSKGNTHTVKVKFTGDANYTFGVDYTDLAQKKAKTYVATPFTVDKTAPTSLKVTYNDEIIDKVLSFFGQKVKVTVYATDKTSTIDNFVYSYIKGANVSDVNSSLENQTVKAKQNGSQFVASFWIPKSELISNNQFRGYVEFSATNRSGLVTDMTDSHTVVVDNISPKGKYEMTGNAIANGMDYYRGDNDNTGATVNLTIDEANFFASDVNVSVTRKSHSTATAVPYEVFYEWTNGEDDLHYTNFTLKEAGEYEVKVTYTDRAGNEMNAIEIPTFVVDNADPVITVSGVEHQSANNDETISLTVTVSDVNLKEENIDLTLQGVFKDENHNVDKTPTSVSLDDPDVSLSGNDTVYTYTIDNIDKDGYYMLSGTVIDLANRSTSLLNVGGTDEPIEEVNFTVNREGSAFYVTSYYDEETEEERNNKILNQYVNETALIKLYEINVDARDPEKETVLVINDGNSSTNVLLSTVENKEPLGEDSSWYKYEYTLDNNHFEFDGVYTITLLSYDLAGNSNLNTKPDKNGNTEGVITFTLDRTAPHISANIRNNQAVDAVEHWVTFDITERNLNADTVEALVDGKKVALTDLGNNEYKFLLSEGTYKSIEITAKDLAGNDSEKCVFTNLTITTNPIELWWNDVVYQGQWVWYVGAIAALAAIVIVVVLLVKKKKNKAQA